MSVISGEDYKCIQGHEQEVPVEEVESQRSQSQEKDPKTEGHQLLLKHRLPVAKEREESSRRLLCSRTKGKEPKSQAAPVGTGRSHLKTPGHTIA